MIFLQKFAPYCRCTLAVILLDRHAAGAIYLDLDASARVRRTIRFFSSHGGCQGQTIDRCSSVRTDGVAP